MGHGLSVLIRCPKYLIIEELLELYENCRGVVDITVPTKSSLKKLGKHELTMKYQIIWNQLQKALKSKKRKFKERRDRK